MRKLSDCNKMVVLMMVKGVGVGGGGDFTQVLKLKSCFGNI